MTALQPQILTHLNAIAQLLGEHCDDDESSALALMRALDAACAQCIGHQLFTVMVVHHSTMEVERLYSNMPDAYPVAGRKKKRWTWWGEHVVERGQAFVGTGAADLERAFADHELIQSLGLGCVLNLPIVYRGLTLGTMNLLHAGAHYRERHVPVARALAYTLLPVLLARSAAASVDSAS